MYTTPPWLCGKHEVDHLTKRIPIANPLPFAGGSERFNWMFFAGAVNFTIFVSVRYIQGQSLTECTQTITQPSFGLRNNLDMFEPISSLSSRKSACSGVSPCLLVEIAKHCDQCALPINIIVCQNDPDIGSETFWVGLPKYLSISLTLIAGTNTVQLEKIKVKCLNCYDLNDRLAEIDLHFFS